MKSLLVALTAITLVMVCVVIFRLATRDYPNPPLFQPAVSRMHSKTPRSRAPSSELVDVSGPLHLRKITRIVLPGYPDWAERDGITGKVSAKIWVRPDGQLMPVLQVTRMGPDARLDDLALEALRQWEFAPLKGATGDQWGVVTFKFALGYEATREHTWKRPSTVPPASMPVPTRWH